MGTSEFAVVIVRDSDDMPTAEIIDYLELSGVNVFAAGETLEEGFEAINKAAAALLEATIGGVIFLFDMNLQAEVNTGDDGRALLIEASQKIPNSRLFSISNTQYLDYGVEGVEYIGMNPMKMVEELNKVLSK